MVLFFLLWRKELGVFETRLLVLISVITNMLYLWSRCVSPGTIGLCHMQVNLTTTLCRATKKESSGLIASILHTTVTDTMPVYVVLLCYPGKKTEVQQDWGAWLRSQQLGLKPMSVDSGACVTVGYNSQS